MLPGSGGMGCTEDILFVSLFCLWVCFWFVGCVWSMYAGGASGPVAHDWKCGLKGGNVRGCCWSQWPVLLKGGAVGCSDLEFGWGEILVIWLFLEKQHFLHAYSPTQQQTSSTSSPHTPPTMLPIRITSVWLSPKEKKKKATVVTFSLQHNLICTIYIGVMYN